MDMTELEPFERYGPWMQVVNRRNKKPIGGKSIDKVSGVGQTSSGVKLGRFASLQSKVANMMEDSRQEKVITANIFVTSKGIIVLWFIIVLDHSKTKPEVKRKVNKRTKNTLKIVQGKETVVGKDDNMMQSLSEQNQGKTEGTRKGKIHDSREPSHVVAPRLSQVKSVARLETNVSHEVLEHIAKENYGIDASNNNVLVGVELPHPNKQCRHGLWDQLVALHPIDSSPWVLGGDFNAILLSSDRLGVERSNSVCSEFGDFIQQSNLSDLGFQGSSSLGRETPSFDFGTSSKETNYMFVPVSRSLVVSDV
ncbi:hypothetical protein GQ457_13G009530 [Hibiscus cannabinus]